MQFAEQQLIGITTSCNVATLRSICLLTNPLTPTKILMLFDFAERFYKVRQALIVLISYFFTNCHGKMKRTNIDNISQRLFYQQPNNTQYYLLVRE